MSMIMPAGINKLNWSPKGNKSKTVKTASAEVKSSTKEVERDALAEAAMKFLGKKAQFEDCESCGSVVSDEEIVADEGSSVGSGMSKEPCETLEISETEDVGDAVDTVVESIEIAVETAEEAIGEAKNAIEEMKREKGIDTGSDIGEVTEVEIDIPGVVDDDVEIEVVDDEVDEVEIDVGDEDEEVEEVEIEMGDEDEDDEDDEVEASIEKESKTVTMSAAASSSEEFCKFAKLSPQNRSKLADYWVNMLGYPKDYVSLLTKDYEK